MYLNNTSAYRNMDSMLCSHLFLAFNVCTTWLQYFVHTVTFSPVESGACNVYQVKRHLSSSAAHSASVMDLMHAGASPVVLSSCLHSLLPLRFSLLPPFHTSPSSCDVILFEATNQEETNLCTRCVCTRASMKREREGTRRRGRKGTRLVRLPRCRHSRPIVSTSHLSVSWGGQAGLAV